MAHVAIRRAIVLPAQGAAAYTDILPWRCCWPSWAHKSIVLGHHLL